MRPGRGNTWINERLVSFTPTTKDIRAILVNERDGVWARVVHGWLGWQEYYVDKDTLEECSPPDEEEHYPDDLMFDAAISEEGTLVLATKDKDFWYLEEDPSAPLPNATEIKEELESRAIGEKARTQKESH